MNVFFVGCGRVATALALIHQSHQQFVTGAAARNPASPDAHQFHALTNVPVYQLDARELSLDLHAAIDGSDFIIISVPDQAVTRVAQTLADADIYLHGKTVAHTSGVLTSAALCPLNTTGAHLLSLHPLQTIAHPVQGCRLLQNAVITLEGPIEATKLAQSWIRSWGGQSRIIQAEDKARYHAAAVLASNAVVALMSVIAQIAPFDGALEAYLPLLRGAVENLEMMGLPNALTGPVERGDLETVTTHLRALQDNPTALRIYQTLGQATVTLARTKGSLTAAQAVTFDALLQTGI